MDILLYLFIAFAIVGVISVAALFLTRSPKVQSATFYFMAFFTLLVAYISASGLPSNYTLQIAISWGLGILGIIAVGIYIKMPEKKDIAKYLMAASVVLGLGKLFFF